MNNFELFSYWFQERNLNLLRQHNEDLARWVEQIKAAVEKRLEEKEAYSRRLHYFAPPGLKSDVHDLQTGLFVERPKILQAIADKTQNEGKIEHELSE